jgi:hypothetical protein
MTDAHDARLGALYAAGATDEALGPHPQPEAIAAAVERRGPEAERVRTLGHVAECPHCRHDFELLRSAHAAGELLAARPWRARGIGVAAAAVLIGAIALSVGRLTAPNGHTVPADRGAPPAGTGRVIDLISPSGGLSATRTPRLVWGSVRGATSYRVEVLDSISTLVARRDTPDTVLVVPALLAGHAYRWWVQATVNGQPWRSAFAEFNTRP